MKASAVADTVGITGLSHDGRGVARLAGKALFVPGALPGETVRLGRIQRHRRYDEATLLEVLTPASDRISPECPHFGVCGGCSLQHLTLDAQLGAKQSMLAETLERIGHVRPAEWWEPLTGPAYGYRRRARFGVRFVRKKGRVLVGFRETGGRYISDSRVCPVMVSAGAELPGALAELIEGLEAKEAIPQVEFAAGDQAAALVFRVLDPPAAKDIERLIAFGRDRGLAVWLQTGGIESLRLIQGSPLLAYALPRFDVTLHCLPTDFIQINAQVNRAMVNAAVEKLALHAGERVLELFSGIGNFTLALARRAGEVVAVEGNVTLVGRAAANAAANGLRNVYHHATDLSAPKANDAWQAGHYDAVLLDPPRSGARELLPALRKLAPSRVFYVSCHPATLARDAAALAELGYRFAGAGMADMFPQTAHVEALALFRRD